MDASTYRARAGANFLTVLNDLKRTVETAAKELGVEVDVLRRVIAGDLDLPADVVRTAVERWPVNERDFAPLHDDCPDGVLVMRAAESAQTSRVFQRGGYDYYEYRDTAASRAALFRPEWIRMLHVVDDDAPANPSVQWNNGHFLFQFTYFVGEVNYYYEWNGRRSCAAMETGDSVFGLPFAPHSFASRRRRPLGRILALTYGGRLMGDAQHELAVLGPEAAARFVLPVGEPRASQAARLRLHLANGSFSVDAVAAAAGVPRPVLGALLAGEAAADPDTRRRLAEALGVPEHEVAPVPNDTADGIRLSRRARARRWAYPAEDDAAYLVTELAGSVTMPSSRALELEVAREERTESAALQHSLHQYGYNVGPQPVLLDWATAEGLRRVRIDPEDSFYVRPWVRHWFTNAGAEPGRVLTLRIGGRLCGDALVETSLIGTPHIERVVRERQRWFDPQGRN